MTEFPLLSNDDRGFFEDGKCPICRTDLKTSGRGLFYIRGGAMLFDESGQNSILTDRLRAFLAFGYHGIDDRSLSDRPDTEIVKNLTMGQFDLNFCSMECLRRFLDEVLAALQHDIDNPEIDKRGMDEIQRELEEMDIVERRDVEQEDA